MFRYTIIDVGDDLVVFNKDDGALGSRRDSWPPRFPTGNNDHHISPEIVMVTIYPLNLRNAWPLYTDTMPHTQKNLYLTSIVVPGNQINAANSIYHIDIKIAIVC